MRKVFVAAEIKATELKTSITILVTGWRSLHLESGARFARYIRNACHCRTLFKNCALQVAIINL
jgi:hypothetical protein